MNSAMSSTNCQIVVNDILNALRVENNRLSHDLCFERKLNEILVNVRKYSLVLFNDCKCDQNADIRQRFSEYNTCFDALKTKKDMTEDNEEVIESNANINEKNVTKINDISRIDDSMETLITAEVLPICGPLEEDLESHVNRDLLSQNNRQPFECRICSQFFDNSDVFTTHWTQKHNIIVTNDDNNVCEENPVFDSDQLIPRVVAQNVKKTISNQLCRKRGRPKKKKKSGLNREIKREPNAEEMPVMGASSHRLSPNETPFDGIKCNECQKCFVSETRYEIHVNRYHRSDGKEFRCRHCLKSFYANNSLLNHLSQTHRIASFGCDLCTHSTFSRPDLIRHRRSHSTHKPFLCAITGCTKAYFRKDHLLNHKRRVHLMAVTAIPMAL